MATRRRGSGEGSVFFDDGRQRWVAMIDLGRDGGGRRQRIWRTGKTKGDALASLRQARGQVDRGEDPRESRHTVTEAASDFVARGIPAHLAAHTRYELEQRAQEFGSACGVRPLTKLTVRDVEDYLAGLAAAGKSASTVRRSRSVAVRVVDHATRIGWLSLERRNPATLARMPQTTPRPARYTPDDDAVRRLLAAAQGEWWYPLLTFVAVTGCRIGEACALAWSDVNLAGMARLRRAVRCNPHGPLTVVEPKSGSARVVALPAELVELLRAHRKRVAEVSLRYGKPAPDLAFPTTAGTLLDPVNARRWLREIAKRAGLPITGFHALRHAASSSLQDDGLSPLRVAGLLGHRNVATTTGTYTHPIQPVADAALERGSRLLATAQAAE
jgi:integrase